ncbi:MAG: type II toxin-antitoxin system prevent-host-death family antitoxin [Gammaproteobacteria bacterium]|nr:type II toxin-antitoxin system prevent-host-death family antitoxin [Gammaproteobacteria bacterium]MDE0281113.1 type II toxin-antitoxin system prevent-host-death family antitoxin [Gammaproteobacteria bacterium]MXX15916.1 type II toxin-antitoxin system Phd/YefM family antitoxin [Gammaproteobacteria bacterium]
MQVTIAQAKAKFAELIRHAEAGEPVVITRRGRPVAALHATDSGVGMPLIGAMKGKIEISDDFNDLPQDFMAPFLGSTDPE